MPGLVQLLAAALPVSLTQMTPLLDERNVDSGRHDGHAKLTNTKLNPEQNKNHDDGKVGHDDHDDESARC